MDALTRPEIQISGQIEADSQKVCYLPFDFLLSLFDLLAKKRLLRSKMKEMETRNVQNLANSGDQSPGRTAAPVSLSPTSHQLPIADD